MDPIEIKYQLKFSPKQVETFTFELDPETFELPPIDVDSLPQPPPDWAALDFKKCENCTLDAAEHPHCPIALRMHDVVGKLHNTKSIDEIEVEVITEERRIIQTTAIQKIVEDIFELVFPICGCPVAAHLRPLSRFHSPLSSEEDTIFRATGMFLLAQYFLKHSGKDAELDFDGLVDIYENLHTMHVAVARRIQAATSSDSVKNAVTLLDMYSTLIPMLIEDELEEMRGFFKAFLPEDAGVVRKTANLLEKAKAFSLELEPIEGSSEDIPDWLKTSDEPEPLAETGAVANAEEEDPLKDRTFSFDLEPIEGEGPAGPSSGKANFGLPED